MKRILVAPLNWGLGHATRCIPIINALLDFKFQVTIASDGLALDLLRKEFPNLNYLELPSYNITYPENGNFKSHFLKLAPSILKAIKSEKKVVQNYVKRHQIDGIISDNRYGVRHPNVPSVFITHQLNVMSGATTWLSSKLQQQLISKFDVCWVPDFKDEPSLSGNLGHSKFDKIPVKYIGPLSRLKKKDLSLKYKLLVLLSGPEPQRTLLENSLRNQLRNYTEPMLFVRGVVTSDNQKKIEGNVYFVDYMISADLEIAVNQSEIVLARSGYSTIMDLASLEKKAFFIPTPGQFEQEYLAKRLDELNIAPCCLQTEFNLEKLKAVVDYSGFKTQTSNIDFEDLFRFFERK
ncbi:glycosyltransferase [Winogradskyella maritima]|uniref:Glycosyltransferase n=1 Tax=Winogradskyella maritima TaxID=1517766 RepID=A0ABV8AFD9_9FLAO|nr:glycosyltransferase [Winogradskyella maritima]